MSPHISATKDDIAHTVIMPGDPLRAKFIAENFLKDAILVNEVRGMLAYTGFYNGHRITVMGSGMGIASMGIYSYELYNMFDVENIIRIGTCGAYTDNLNLRDVVVVESTYAETDYDNLTAGKDSPVLQSSSVINHMIKKVAESKNISLVFGKTHCTDVFYKKFPAVDKYFYEHSCIAVEMEAFSLFQNANLANKQAACILTVSDSLVTGEATSSEERQESFVEMIILALETAIRL